MTFAEAMAAAERQLNLRATILCVDSFSITADEVMSVSIEEGGQMPLGSVTSARYTMELPNANNEYLRNGSKLGNRSLIGARVTIEIGVFHDGAWDWQPLGVFIVEKTTAREHDTRIRLTGNDPLVSLDVLYEDKLTYRYNTTLGDILTHIKGKGFAINGALATNSNAIVNFTPDWGEEPTLREVLGYVVQMGGSFVRCDRQGNIQILPANGSTTHAITTDKYLEFTDDERYFNFNRIKVLPNGAKKDRDYVEAFVTSADESAANTIVIDGNPLFKTKSTTTYIKATTWREGRRYYLKVNNKYTLEENPQEQYLGLYYTARTIRNTTNLQAMVTSLKNALTGMSFRAINFTWRGNPQVQIGDKISLVDTRGVTTTTVIIQQSLRFDNGFRSEISCPLDLAAVMPSVITSSGRVAQPYFGEGTIDGSVIMPESITSDLIVAGGITARNVAAKTITAEEIAAKTITAEEIAAKTITANEMAAKTITANEIAAGTITAAEIGASQINATHIGANEIIANTANVKDGVITNAKIADGTIETAKIKDAQITNAKIANGTIETAKIKDGQITTAKIADAQITNAKIAAAGIDFAKLKDMVAGTAIITEGVGGKLYIARLAVTEANMVSLTVGEMIVKGSDGRFYTVVPDGQGGVTTQLKQVVGNDVANNTIAGGKLIENTITARELNVSSIFADTALIRAIKAANIDVADLFAAQATITELDAYIIKASTITALKGQLDVWAQNKIDLTVGNIQVGGTNMVPYSNSLMDMTKWRDWGDQATFTQVHDVVQLTRPVGSTTPIAISSREYIRFVTGVEYMLSFNYAPYYTDSVPINWVKIYSNSELIGLPWGNIVDLGLSTDKYSPTGYIRRKALLFTVPRNIDDGNIIIGCNPPDPATRAEGFRISKIKIEQGNKATPWSPHPADPASGVKTSHITVESDLIDIGTGGNVQIAAGATLSMEAGTVQIESADASASFLQFGDAFYVGKEGNQYQLNINSRAEDAIQINNKSVWHKGNIVVQQNQPASGKQIIWLKPNATTSAEYKTTITTTANLHYSHPVNSRSFNLSAQSSDTLSAAGTYNFAVTIQFKRYGGDGSGTYDTTGGTVVLTKGGATLSMNLPAMVFGSWESKTINLTGSTTSTAFTATTGDIACAITITGVKPYTSSDFIAHVKPSDIRCVITGPGGSTAQPCQVFFVP